LLRVCKRIGSRLLLKLSTEAAELVGGERLSKMFRNLLAALADRRVE